MSAPLRCFLLLAFLPALGCRTAAPAPVPPGETKEGTVPSAKGAPIRLTLVGTNDVHGWVYPQRTKLSNGVELKEGGLAALAGYLEILRKENPGGVLLLDGGDLFQGTLAVNLTEGQVVIEAFNHLGYTAAALGNHEFDYGPVGPVSVAAQPGLDPFGALKERLIQARFPLLAVNLYETHTGERPAWIPNDGTLLVDVKGVKVGIFGLITPQTPQTTNPVNVATLRFGSLVPEAQSAAARLRQKGAELVVAIAHAGGKCGQFANPNDLSSCDLKTGEIFELMQGVAPGTLDAVIRPGHTHQGLGHLVNGTPVIETPGLGRSFGIIELEFDPVTRRVLADKTRITPVISVCEQVDLVTGGCDGKKLRDAAPALVPATFRGQSVVTDAALERLLAPALQRVDAEQQRKLSIAVPKPLTRNYEAESALGSLLADSLRELEKGDIALLNPGGLRAEIPSGDLTYGDVYAVLPFDNTVSTVTVTGEELRRLLEAAYGSRKGVFQVSGLKVKVSECPGQGRLVAFTLTDGKQVQADARYRVIMPDFLARGGDGLGPVMSSLPPSRVDLGMRRELNFREALVDHWQRKGQPLVAPSPGRISVEKAAKGCGEAVTPSSH